MTKPTTRSRIWKKLPGLKHWRPSRCCNLAKKNFTKDRSGVAAVEAALILPVFALVMLGLIEGSRALYTTFEFDYAVYKTSRYAMVKTGATTSQIEAKLNQEFIMLDPGQVATFNVTETLNSDKTRTTVITASYNFDFLFAIFNTSSLTFNSTQTLLRF